MIRYCLTALILLFISNECSSQALIDSIYSQIAACKTKDCELSTKFVLANELLSIDLKKAEDLTSELIGKCPIKDTANYFESRLLLGFLLMKKEDTDSAFQVFEDLYKLSKKQNLPVYLYRSQLGLSKYYTDKNDLQLAIDYGFQALKGLEKIKNNFYSSLAYSQIATINHKLRNTDKAIDYYKKALEIAIKGRMNNNIAYIYNNLGNLHSSEIKMYDIALEYYKRALGIRKQQKHELEIAPILSNMGTIYYERKEYKVAEVYYREALGYNIKIGRNSGAAICLSNLGSIYYDLNDFKHADSCYRAALNYLTDDFQIKEMLYYNLGEVNLKLGNLENALKYNDTCMTIKDSLYSREAIKSLNDMQVKYETEKTQLELEKKDLESKNKQVVIYAALGGCILLVGIAFFIFRGSRQKSRDNKILEEKNVIISEKSKIVEEQHKDITDSIKYAERIQTAILPPEKLWKQILPQSFIYYRPKDVLSGDFYWIEETKTHTYVAAADCTGHGVPGALVSIINYNLLNKAVLEKNLTDPAQILNQVNEWLTQALHQSFNATSMRDGMDVSICAIEKKTKKMKFAGAFNSGYIIKDGIVEEMPADKKPVGAFIEDDITSFTSKEYQLTGNETIYLFSDGYADQFGGPKGKKFKYKNLQKMLLDAQDKNFDQQKAVVQETFVSWKGNYEQTDDVLLIGFRIT